MKTKLILPTLLAIMLCISTDSISQVNTYFMNNPVWQISKLYDALHPCFQYDTYNYYINGDTIFNSLVYKKVFKKGQGYYQWFGPPPVVHCSNPPYFYIDSHPSYFLRSIGKQIFLRQPLDTNEHLLYDFNLKVGDTLPTSYNNPAKNIPVAAIDSVSTPYGYLKRFTLKNPNGQFAKYLIEGIGTSQGLVEPIYMLLENNSTLNCFSLNDVAYYPAVGQTCNMTVGITCYKNERNHSIYPNPFTTSTTLEFNSMTKNAQLYIYNSVGQLVKQIKNISDQPVTLFRDNLLSGLYFIRLTQDDKVIATDKLIITDN